MLKTMTTRSCKQTFSQASTDDGSEVLIKKLKFEVINDTKLTDLNYDCLLSIFKLLAPYDALKMLHVHNKFVEPINGIVRKLSVQQHTFTLSLNIFCFDRPAFYNSLIYVSYPHLKYIGQSISKILIDFDGTFEGSVSAIEESILEYCTELTELQLVNSLQAPFETIKTLVAKLEVLHLSNCSLGPVFCQFSKWLPKLRSLTVMNCKVLDESCIRSMGMKMPALEYIHLDDVRKIVLDKFNEEAYHLCNVDEIITSNGHVKYFRSLSDKKPRRLQLISKRMKHLEGLDLQIQIKHFKGSSFTSINFKWVTKLVLKIGADRMTWTPCPFMFEVLEELQITCDNSLNKQWIFFAGLNKLQKFQLVTLQSWGLKMHDLFKISSTWPSLIEVSTHFHAMNVDKIDEFIHSFSNLQRLNIIKRVSSRFSNVRPEQLQEVGANLTGEYELLPGTDEYHCSFIRSI